MEIPERAEKKQTKISVPESVLELALSAHTELKQRGSQAKLDELFVDLLNGATKEYFDKQVEKLTPDEYVLELAKKSPEGLAYLVKQAKKVLETMEKGGNLRASRGRKPANLAPEAAV